MSQKSFCPTFVNEIPLFLTTCPQFAHVKLACMQRNPRNVGMTLPFAILTKNASIRSYGIFAYLLRANIRNIKCVYTVEPPIADPPKSGRPPDSGQPRCPRMTSIHC